MQALVTAIEYYVPERTLTNRQLADASQQWTADKIQAKTGIAERRIAASQECSSDLAVAAANRLFSAGACEPEEIDYVLLCTQSPDYFLPTTACLLQERLGLRTSCGALDFNLGCSGFIYGLGLAKGLIETGQARSILLLTAETYSKFIAPGDMNVRTLFGDGAAATLVQAAEANTATSGGTLGPFVYGTDGRGAKNLIVEQGGMRRPAVRANGSPPDRESGEIAGATRLFMNGPEIFTFTLRAVPKAVHALFDRSELTLDDVDLFIFHQANEYMLEHLRDKLKIPPDRFYIKMRHCGNTVSSTIPIALKHALVEGRVGDAAQVMLVGFGVGYSWGATMLRWNSGRGGVE